MSNSSNTTAEFPDPIIDLSYASIYPGIVFCLVFQIAVILVCFISIIYFLVNFQLVKRDSPSASLTNGRIIVILLLEVSLAAMLLSTCGLYMKSNDTIWILVSWAVSIQSILMDVFNLQVIALFSILLPKYMRIVTKKTVLKYQMIFSGIGVVLCGGYLTKFWAYSDSDPNMKYMVLVCF